jgi:2-methylisocitrate lyase-like PEP mutase family enzyme
MADQSVAANDPTTKRRRLRELLARPSLLVMPGGFSPVYANAAELAGFESFFLAGSQMSGFLAGVPDTGIIGLRDIVDHARHVAAHSTIPILLDADTGFGNAVNVHYAVQEIVRSGVAAVQLEDQEAPKKSGTGGGRRCIPMDEAVGKIRAAIAARDAIDPAFVVCARVDTIGAEGASFAETVERCIAYATQGGADLIWLNAVQTRAQLKEVCARTPAPVLCNWWSNVEAKPTLEEFQQLGTRIALYPTIASQIGLQAAWHVLNDFRQRGDAALSDWSAWVKASPYGAVDYRRLTRHSKVRQLEEKFLPRTAQRDYDSDKK